MKFASVGFIQHKILLFSLLFGWSDQEESICRCYPRVYRSVLSSLDVMESPAFEMTNCNKVLECRNLCQDVFKVLGDGNLSYELSNGKTVGEMLCHGLAEKNVLNIQRKTVHVYSRVCNRTKQYAGKRSERNALCCVYGRFQKCE